MREAIRERLIRCVRGNRPPHALILAGLDTAGAYLLARETASAFCFNGTNPGELKNCPDFQEADGGTVSMEQAREIISELAMTSVQGKSRCILIQNAHRMSILVQNTFLKIIEEPPDHTLLILTGNETGILQTIRSRCMIIRIGGEEPKQIRQELIRQGKTEQIADLCSRISDGIYGDAVRFANQDFLEFRAEAVRFFEKMLFETVPFQEIRSLISVSGGVDGSEKNEGEDSESQGKKKRKKPDIGRMQDLLNIWQTILRDALYVQIMRESGYSGNSRTINQDLSELVCRISACLPSKTIQSIIEMLLKAQESLANGAYPTTVLDVLAADIIGREKV